MELPFKNNSKLQVYFVSYICGSEVDLAYRDNLKKLMFEIIPNFESELGCPLELMNHPEDNLPIWYFGPLDVTTCNFIPIHIQAKLASLEGPYIYLDQERKYLVSNGQNTTEVMETLSYIRCLARGNQNLVHFPECESYQQAANRIKVEIENSYAGFHVRDINWDQIVAEFEQSDWNKVNFIDSSQKLFAKLGDPHTGVKKFPRYVFDYGLVVNDKKQFIFNRVPETSQGWKYGLRVGDQLEKEKVSYWWDRTAGTDHGKFTQVGFKVLSTNQLEERQFFVRKKTGGVINWSEAPDVDPWQPLLASKILKNNVGYIQIKSFQSGKGLVSLLDLALKKIKDCQFLILDLRNNPGGSFIEAYACRERFLLIPGQVGWEKITHVDGTLGEAKALVGKSSKNPWNKGLYIITNAGTYSAAEDFMLGLKNQKNVKIVGQNSGGGSGRVRILNLIDGYKLMISTGLTYTMEGQCIENQGIQVDWELPFDAYRHENEELQWLIDKIS